jgi:hypothetical protein
MVDLLRSQRRAHELNPNDSTSLFFLAWTEASEGNVGRAKELAAQAIRMSPKDRYLGTAHLAFAMSAFVADLVLGHLGPRLERGLLASRGGRSRPAGPSPSRPATR